MNPDYWAVLVLWFLAAVAVAACWARAHTVTRRRHRPTPPQPKQPRPRPEPFISRRALDQEMDEFLTDPEHYRRQS